MKANRAFRIVFGVIVIALFCVYTYIHFSEAPFSEDAGKLPSEPAAAAPAESAAPESESEPESEPEPAPSDTPAPTVDPNSPEGKAAALGLPKPPEIDITSWEFLMANPSHNISDYTPQLVNYSTADMPANIQSNQGMQFDERIVEPMTRFITAAGEAGLNVFLSSGYRSFDEQTYLYNRKLGQGYTEEQAKRIVAVPGTSEHQTGLVCDITDRYYETKDPDILKTTELFKWMNDHCSEYGFILRYPEDKQDITEVMYEPWHFRYVGADAAKYITENHLCYEEFYALYTDE